MLKVQWQKHIQWSGWQEPKDDKAILFASIYITLANPKPRGKERPRRGFYQTITVPADATEKQKNRAVVVGKNLLIDGFDKHYNAQSEFMITDKTKPFKYTKDAYVE